MNGFPPRQGLYDPQHEHDSCGVGFVVDLKGRRSRSIVANAIEVLLNLEHRGACGCEVNTGDGAGILLQIPHKFFEKECAKDGIKLPARGHYSIGNVFMPQDKDERKVCREAFEKIVAEEGQTLLGWRNVPQDNSTLGPTARATEPDIRQIIIGRAAGVKDDDAFERKLFLIRKRIENQIRNSELKQKKFFYLPSLSCRTIIYKGMFNAPQVKAFFPDLSDPLCESAIALVHQRFSTNTFPTWDLAHPFRYLAHNGEINTLRGNFNWMRAREALFECDYFTKEE